MYNLRCTARMLRRMGLDREPMTVSAPVQTVLGDWYCDLLCWRPQHLILAVSSVTRLPVVLPGRDLDSFPERLAEALGHLLHDLGIPGPAVESEQAKMGALFFGRTQSRSILATMNQYRPGLRDLVARGDFVCHEATLRLAHTPLLSPVFSFPDEATLARFGLGPGAKVVPFPGRRNEHE